MSKQAKQARAFFREIKSEEPAPIYFVYGDESYLLDKAVDAIIEAACPEGINDFNYDFFQGRDIDGDRIYSCVQMLPMMAKRRLVVVRDFQEVKPSTLDPLKPYFKDPSPATCLIVHARTQNKSIDGRLGIIRALKKAAKSCEFKALYENELGPFLARQAKKRGLRLRRDASAYLVDAVGTEMGALVQALTKVDLYLGESADGEVRDVTAEDAQAVVARTKNHSVFALTDALGERDYQTSLEVMERMLLDGASPLMFSHMIARHFRIIAKLQDRELRNASKKDASKAVRVNPFFLKDYQRHARAFSPDEVRAILRELLEVDAALKSSGISERVVLERLLTNICFRHDQDKATGGFRR